MDGYQEGQPQEEGNRNNKGVKSSKEMPFGHFGDQRGIRAYPMDISILWVSMFY